MANVPSIFRDEKSVVMAAPQGVDEITRRLLGGNGLNLKRISIKGGKWRMIMGGEQIAASNSDTLDVVVVNAAPHVSRYWYNKGYDGKSVGAPDCWSNDGVRPDPKAKQPQANQCEGCPKNIAGSGPNGQGRACRYARRLALTLANDVGNSEVYQIQLPPTSMFGKAKDEDHMGLDAYVRHLAGYNYSITGVVTEMRFDPNAEAPRIYFRAVRRLTDEERSVVVEKGQSQEALAAISFNPGSIDTANPAPAKGLPFRDEVKQDAPTPPPVHEPKAPQQAFSAEVEEEQEPVQAEPVAETPEPIVRRNQTKAAPVPAEKVDMAKLIDSWDLDDDE